MARASLTPWRIQAPYTLLPSLPGLRGLLKIFLVHGMPCCSAKHISLHIDFGLV